jgi:hypothetical protein
MNTSNILMENNTMNATHETPAENLQSGPNKKCADPECISGFIDIYQIAPDGSIMCKTHARAAWFQYRLKVNPSSVRPSANPAPRPTKNPFASLSKLSGVMIQYPGYFHLKDGVRSIWTKTRCYPYPDKRKKLGMAGSYPTGQCLVVNWGKHQDPTKAEPQAVQ